MAITEEVFNERLKDYQKPEDLLGQDGLLKQLQKRLLEKSVGGGVDGAFGIRVICRGRGGVIISAF